MVRFQQPVGWWGGSGCGGGERFVGVFVRERYTREDAIQ